MAYVGDFLLFISLILPKAGVKISGFPLYFSMLATLFFFLIGFFYILRRKSGVVWFFLLFFVIFISFIGGVESVGAAYLSSRDIFTYLIPMLSVLVFYGGFVLGGRDSRWVSVLAVSFWGLIFYAAAQKIFGDYSVVVPGVTANYQDAIKPDFLADKNNMIWGLNYLKVTATYQNGNVFGVNLIVIGFVYIATLIERGLSTFLPLIALSVVSILTASASVYIGLVVGVVHIFWRVKGGAGAIFFRILLGVFLGMPILAYLVLSDSFLWQLFYERFLGRDLVAGGGRVDKVAEYFGFISERPILIFTGMLFESKEFSPIYEMTLLSIAQFFGVFSAIYVVAFLGSKIYFLRSTPYATAFIAYFAASLSDGAFWLPPTATNIFLLLGIVSAWVARTRKLS